MACVRLVNVLKAFHRRERTLATDASVRGESSEFPTQKTNQPFNKTLTKARLFMV
jgi:hypothetical protein